MVGLQDSFRDSKGYSYHIKVKKGTLSGYTLNAGSPERVEMAAKLLNGSKLISSNRGLPIYSGTYDKTPVTLFCTGMGPGSAEIVYTEVLTNIDLKMYRRPVAIRVGTAGSWSPMVNVGDIVAETGIIRNEGAGLKIAPVEWPARTDMLTDLIIAETASKMGLNKKIWFGPGITKDTLYADEEPESRSAIPWQIEAKQKSYDNMGALSTSMESAPMALITEMYNRMLSSKGIRISFSSLLLVVSPYYAKEENVQFKVTDEDEISALKLGLASLNRKRELDEAMDHGKKIDFDAHGTLKLLYERLTY
ncbi:MAG: hypothetical protein JRN26_02725 [Nitrososphaerota archaeon]|jgi:uridine phosphorylase|nr:hypothetical protein [Nitrososphaerota archaeon]MDG6930918.1 hypothetical protein [Nitrososphaerota archaeon]MDG6932218.1 hypothetical protein [Nitrososphaerota archaeon]MDG6935789.1 hypothetical protein [Nitrososphaerota archaeon]MDG6944107.1 hypothetical protein [Nitrososphaerota archaeon]